MENGAMRPACSGGKTRERGRHPQRKNPMEVLNDPLRVHDMAQAIRHRNIAKVLAERCPETGERLGHAKLRGNAQRLMDMYSIGTAHPLIWTGGAR